MADLIEGEDLGSCPFCGGTIAAALGEDRRPNGIIHSLPFCERFDRLPADEFIVAVRLEIEGRLS